MNDPPYVSRHKASTGLALIRQPANIIRLAGASNYSWVYYAASNQPSLLCRTLKDLEGYLPSFLRASKQSLINPAFIAYILVVTPLLKEYVVFTDASYASLSRRRARLLRDELLG